MIKLYTTHCPNCKALEIVLNKKGLEYETCEDMVEMVNKGFASVPMLETDDGLFTYLEALKWVKEHK